MAQSFRAVVFPLAAPVEMGHHALSRVATQVPERFARVAVFEIVAPTAQEGVEVVNHLGRGFVAFLRAGFLADRIAGFFQPSVESANDVSHRQKQRRQRGYRSEKLCLNAAISTWVHSFTSAFFQQVT